MRRVTPEQVADWFRKAHQKLGSIPADAVRALVVDINFDAEFRNNEYRREQRTLQADLVVSLKSARNAAMELRSALGEVRQHLIDLDALDHSEITARSEIIARIDAIDAALDGAPVIEPQIGAPNATWKDCVNRYGKRVVSIMQANNFRNASMQSPATAKVFANMLHTLTDDILEAETIAREMRKEKARG